MCRPASCDFDFYSGLVLVNGFVVSFLVYGLAWTVGVLYVVFLEHLEYESPPQVAVGVALTCAVVYVVGPPASVLVGRFGCRRVGMVGGGLAGGALILTTLSRHVGLMIALFGVVTGIGLGLAAMASNVVICTHFNRFRPIALGITSSAIGAGSLAYPPLMRALVDHFGWRGTLQLVGATTLNLVVCAALYRPVQVPESPTACTKGRTKERWRNSTHFQIFTEKYFVALCFSSVLLCIGFSVVHVHLPAFAATLGIDEHRSALLFSVMGIGCIIGRLGTGVLNQVPACNGFLLYTLFFGLSGFCVIGMPLGGTYNSLIGLCLAFGILTGCYGIVVPDIIIRLLGVARVGPGYGYSLLFMGIGQALGGPLAGILYEVSGRYSTTMYFGGAVFISGGLIMLPGLLNEYGRQKVINYESTIGVEPEAPGPPCRTPALLAVEESNHLTVDLETV